MRAAAAAQGRDEGLAGVSEFVVRAARARDRLLAELEPQLVDLAFEVARRVLERAVERDRGAVAELASLALESVRQRKDVTLRVHPDDASTLREAEPLLCHRLARERCIGFVEDASVGRGGIIVETEAGTVDARLSTHLDALRRALGDTAPTGREPRAPGAEMEGEKVVPRRSS